MLGRTNLGDHPVTNSFVLYKPVLTLGCLKSFVKVLTQSDIMLDITIDPNNGSINGYNTFGNALLHDGHEVGGPAGPKFVNIISLFD